MAKNEYMVLDSTRICPVCMKEFFIPDIEQWAYKHWETNKKKKRIYFCSWGCMRKYEKDNSMLTGRGMMLSTKRLKIWQLLDEGRGIQEIARMLDITTKQVSYYKSKWIPKEKEAGDAGKE